MLERIVSGGQTGVDRGALDGALAAGVGIGGWIPKGRKAEDGVVPASYAGMREAPIAGYVWRTERNTIDSDATLVLWPGDPRRLSGGSKRTVEFAERNGKPVRVFPLRPDFFALGGAAFWIHENGFKTLNVAGPRESKRPGCQALAAAYVAALAEKLRDFAAEDSAPRPLMAAEPGPAERNYNERTNS